MLIRGWCWISKQHCSFTNYYWIYQLLLDKSQLLLLLLSLLLIKLHCFSFLLVTAQSHFFHPPICLILWRPVSVTIAQQHRRFVFFFDLGHGYFLMCMYTSPTTRAATASTAAKAARTKTRTRKRTTTTTTTTTTPPATTTTTTTTTTSTTSTTTIYYYYYLLYYYLLQQQQQLQWLQQLKQLLQLDEQFNMMWNYVDRSIHYTIYAYIYILHVLSIFDLFDRDPDLGAWG